jgi:hypothetical protein
MKGAIHEPVERNLCTLVRARYRFGRCHDDDKENAGVVERQLGLLFVSETNDGVPNVLGLGGR